VSRFVTPDYFRALTFPSFVVAILPIRIRTGNESKNNPEPIVSCRLFPDEDPVGKRIQASGLRSDVWSTVVGVADNVKNSGLTEQSDPEIYFVRRSAGCDWDGKRSDIAVDSVMPASAVEPWVRSEIASIDPTVPVKMEPLDQTVSRLADRPRFETALLAFFAGTGMLLAIVGSMA